jgi:hypothetical protein
VPAVSQAQRRHLYREKGAAWVKEHGFDNKGLLPEHVKPGKKKRPHYREGAEKYRRAIEKHLASRKQRS